MNIENEVTESAFVGQEFVAIFDAVSEDVHCTARQKGWWDRKDLLESLARNAEIGEHNLGDNLCVGLASYARNVNMLSELALIHSEVSEAVSYTHLTLPTTPYV